MHKLRQRLQREEGFTLIELLVVIVIIGILLAIAVPSYLGFKDRANEKAAWPTSAPPFPSAEAYYADTDDYTCHDRATARGDDQALKLDAPASSRAGGHARRRRYCLDMTRRTSRSRTDFRPAGAAPPPSTGQQTSPAPARRPIRSG